MNANTVQWRSAERSDIPAMQALIAASAIGLSTGFYTPAQAAAMLEHVFGVDTQLLVDHTYFVYEEQGQLLACGGWSKRKTLFGGDQAKQEVDPLLDPAVDAARIRAFFVAPVAARRGLARQLLAYCEQQASAAGFARLELAATMPGLPFYLACGFAELERITLHLPGCIDAEVCRMCKQL